MAERLRHPTRPVVLLILLTVISLAARIVWLGQPCRSPCRSAAQRVLIFDEQYYVNAARVIAGRRPPATAPYARAPLGDDPNSEHPQLAKLMMAGAIELLGDGPLAWRLGSVIAGSLAIVAMFALVRSTGGSRQLALTAAALMASDNLLLVHGRIATLDIYVACAMLWAAVLYLRRRPVFAGVALGIAACFKLVAPYLLVVLAVLELLRVQLGPGEVRRALLRLVSCASVACLSFVALLMALDRLAAPYDAAANRRLPSGALHHLSHMLSYAAAQTSPHGPRGIASYPWEWLVDLKPIVYLNVNPARPTADLAHVHPAVHFLGMISPPLLLLALPGVALAICRLLHARRSLGAVQAGGGAGGLRSPGEGAAPAALAVAWIAGTLLPFAALSAIWSRTAYLYYMVIVMPGFYLAAALLAARVWQRRPKLMLAWAGALLLAAVAMYPLTPVP